MNKLTELKARTNAIANGVLPKYSELSAAQVGWDLMTLCEVVIELIELLESRSNCCQGNQVPSEEK